MCSLYPVKHVLNLTRAVRHILCLQIFSKYVNCNIACLNDHHIHYLQIHTQCDEINQTGYGTAKYQ